MADYFSEHLVPAHRQQLQISEVVLHDRSASQEILVFRNPLFGTVLALDKVVQTTTGDEFVYHEMMTHVPLLAHGQAENVLIIGGGDGGILRHVLMHKNVKHVTMVEIEPMVVDLAKQYMPSICGEAFNDPRTHLIIGDGCQFVRDTHQRFDVIIVDSTDPEGPGEVLFTPQFYADCKRSLTAGGVLVTQSGVPFTQPSTVQNGTRDLGQSFAHVSFYVATIPTYISGQMAMGFGSDNPALRQMDVATLEKRLADSGITDTHYYTPAVHQAAFALPRYIERLMQPETPLAQKVAHG